MRNKDRIVLPYFRCNLLHLNYKGITRISRPKRKGRFGDWRYIQVTEKSFSDSGELSDKVFELQRRAKRLINLNAQTKAESDRETLVREKKREEFVSWAKKKWGYLSETYRKQNTTIYAGNSDYVRDRDERFIFWLPKYLKKNDLKDELSAYKEKKQSLGVIL